MPKGRRPPARRRARRERGFAPRPVAPTTPQAPRASPPSSAEEAPQDRLIVGEVKRISLIAGFIFALFLLLFLFWR